MVENKKMKIGDKEMLENTDETFEEKVLYME
jgi:hypothetical protein